LLLQLARRFGAATSYVDTTGKRRHASHKTIAAILKISGVAARTPTQIREAILEHEREHWEKMLEPVIVVWDQNTGDPEKPNFRVELRVHFRNLRQVANCTLYLENGEAKIFTARPNHLRTLKYGIYKGGPFVAKQLPVPTLPQGYHQMEVEIAGRTATALIISAPRKTYSDPAAAKFWGAFLPMYAAHSRESWGAGNFGDWQKLTEWIASLGGQVVSTLPLLAAFLDGPVCEPSPYSPASRLFWNEFYLDIPAIPEFSRCPGAQKLVRSLLFQRQLNRFRSSSLIDYRAEMAARRQVLEKLACFFFETDSSRRMQFLRFLRERPQVKDYAEFRAACDQTNLPWQKWPQRMRDGELRTGDYSETQKSYHLYVQWLAQEQITALTNRCRARGVQFYLDLPLGVHPAGYDLWRERDAFATGANVGAPPDAFFSKGQDWGFTPLHPQRLREQGYRYLRDVLSFQMRQTGMLRLDHVMGLHRLYWIPQGRSAKEGAYVSYPAKELYAILSLESHRHKTVLVGENLGTVPEEVNDAMARHGLRQMYVVQFAQRPNPRAALVKPPPRSVASLNTHDMPTFAAHLQGLDIDDRAKLGLFTKAEVKKEHARRAELNLALEKFLRGWLNKLSRRSSRGNEAPISLRGTSNCKDQSLVNSAATRKGELRRKILEACLGWLCASSAELVLINLEDLWGEELPQNVPGTSTELPNWRRKARRSIEEIRTSAEIRRLLRNLSRRVYRK
jgi:4-alpha-glucanotransferase